MNTTQLLRLNIHTHHHHHHHLPHYYRYIRLVERRESMVRILKKCKYIALYEMCKYKLITYLYLEWTFERCNSV